MPITAIFRRLRQRVRNIKNRLIRRASGDAGITTALPTADPEVSENEEDAIPRTERPRYSYHTSSGRSTPLIYRGVPPSSSSSQDEDGASSFSFRRSASTEIFNAAPAIQDDGTHQNDADPVPRATTLSVANADPPASPRPDLSTAESFRATTPSLHSSAHILPFEQKESAEETQRKREAALRMLEGDIPAAASGAYVRI